MKKNKQHVILSPVRGEGSQHLKHRFFAKNRLRMTCFLVSIIFCFLPSVFAKTAYDILDEIPVQHNGRIKPFISFSREVSLNILGGLKYENKKSSELVWQWIANPQTWFSKSFIPVSFKPLQKELGLSVVHGRISPEVVLGNQEVLKDVESIA